MADLINLTIDDKRASVAKGTLIVEAAKTVGIEIPVFCYHPKMKPVGACRMCLVEVGTPRRNPDGSWATNPDGTPLIVFMPKPQTACTTPVSEGMVVRTKSPAVIKAQKGVLEFLLINHPLDCPVCDKGGECPLQDQTFQYGPGASRFAPEDKQHFQKPIDLNDTIALDRERCIMCFRCTRFQEEIAGDPQISVFERGARSEIGVVPGQKWDSNFSGNTIELCPVGALTSKEFRFRARAWEVQNVPSVCPLCAVGCNLTLHVRDNKILRILARDNEEVNECWICDRGRFGYAYINENRLAGPKVRKGNHLEQTGWTETTKAAFLALRHILQTSGPESIGGIVSPRLPNEALYVFQKMMRAVIGTNNVDCRIDGKPQAAGAMQAAIRDVDAAQSLLVLGSDIFNDLPILALRLRQATVHGKAKLVMAYPRPAKLSGEAAVWLQHSEGAELALLRGLLRSLVDQGIAKGGSDLVKDVDAGAAARAAGLAAERLAEAARLLAGSAPGMILYGAGLAQGAQGAEIVAALEALAAATGASLNCLVKEANEQGARDMGAAAGWLPGGRAVADAAARQELAKLWNVPSLPVAPGMTGHEMLQAAVDGKLKALWLVGVDPLAAANGDRKLVEQALDRLSGLIVQDISPSLVSHIADIVLPACSFAEIEGTFTNVERRVQRLKPALAAGGHLRADWRIIADVAAELSGAAWAYKTAGDIFSEITHVVPAYAGLSYGVLGEGGKRI